MCEVNIFTILTQRYERIRIDCIKNDTRRIINGIENTEM